MSYDGFQQFFVSSMAQACDDYISSGRKMKKLTGPKDARQWRNQHKIHNECERYIKNYFHLISDSINGDVVVDHLDKIAETSSSLPFKMSVFMYDN